ncbi:serine--tRNA ligase [Bremerella alba]|uniref:Serine--tRNA ligase n=1 Tax=Bremerella alba TaxID=980252 RepID=A0A7V8V697_9BACT|nr:serine--tRNA ligase [Bremerella alba]MBA2115636.1 Serine--tRNA ligase [Bremerella alba]
MLDRKFVVENVELVKKNCENRGVQADVDQIVSLETARKAKLQEAEEFNRQANENNKLVGKASPDERPNIIAEGKRLRQLKDDASSEVDKFEEQIVEILRVIPNLSHPAAPIGEDDKSNLEIQRGATECRTFDFPVLDHVELGEKLDLIDFEAGAQVAGAGFYYLKNEAVLLELALQQYVLSVLMKEGFVPTITPDMARTEILHGVGFIPRGPETQIYSIENTDLNLVATAEITLGGMYAGKTLEAETMPQLFCGISHCYRTEAGAAGRASRGLYRVHQFTKVEMFAFTLPEDSEATLNKFRDLECQIFDGLKIPYRVVDTATGDLGGPAYRKFDLEAWMPGRGDSGEWGEVTSTSNCTDYQARRLNIRYKVKGEKGTHFAHTLNGTAIALSRGLIAVLENYQQADGTIDVPEVLRPYMGIDKIGPR